jgi:type I restriction enzyme R subunit
MLLRQALSLCRSLVDNDKCLEAAYFEAVRTLLTRVTSGNKKLSLKEINNVINEFLKASIKSSGVINLFSDMGKDFSLFDQKFLRKISQMEERNLAVEMLKKLLEEQVSIYRRTNLVRSEKFSNMLSLSLDRYIKGMITNEEVIAELIKMADEIIKEKEQGNELGLSPEEQAFYDALTKPQAVKDFYENDVLVQLTRELTVALRKSRTIDWQRKESARASMRSMVKRLLKQYKYPPDGVDYALDTVISQCEMWADN